MIEKMEQSDGKVIGFKMIGKIKKKDYPPMVAELEALVAEHGNLNLLMDMSEFKWEKVSAWGSDMKFGTEFRKKINKAAFIGDKKWHNMLAWIAQPFFANELEYFDSQEREAAWAWLQEA